MAKASDLFNKLGGQSSGNSKPSLSLNQPSTKKTGAQAGHVAAGQKDLGSHANKTSKAQGNAGKPGGRPKV